MEAVDCYRTKLSDFWCRLLVPAAHRPRQASLNCRFVVLPYTCGRTDVLEFDVSALFSCIWAGVASQTEGSGS